ncbi:MAG: hypothetical protein ACI87W_000049 [Halieaceae bacterium]|jgi:hypothetical protein
MAEETKATSPVTASAPKGKAAAAAATKTTAKRKPVARKTTAKRKSAARKAPSLQSRVNEAGRSAFLASLGVYGMAFDQMQEQFQSVEGRLSARRKKADKLYQEMVKRGAKVEKTAKSAIEDLEMPKLDVAELTDRAKLDAQLAKARARFAELKQSVGFKKAA